MKALNFLIICLIVLNNIISTSKGAQKSIEKKEGLSKPNNKRKLKYENSIVIAFTSGCTYSNGFKLEREIVKTIDIFTNEDDVQSIDGSTPFSINNKQKIRVYFESAVKSLAYFATSNGYDTNAHIISSVDFINFDSSILTDMYYLFYGCTSLRSVNFGDSDYSKVQDMSGMFWYCNKLESIDLSKFTFEKTNKIENMISDCYSLISIELPNFKNTKLSFDSILKYNNQKLALKYINLYNSEISIESFSNFIDKTLKKFIASKLNVCLKEENFNKLAQTSVGNMIKNCCNNDNDNSKCGQPNANNIIVIEFNKDCNYNKGFINDYRTNVEGLYQSMQGMLQLYAQFQVYGYIQNILMHQK